MMNKRPEQKKPIEIDESTERLLKSAMFVLMRMFKKDAKKEVFSQINEEKRKLQAV